MWDCQYFMEFFHIQSECVKYPGIFRGILLVSHTNVIGLSYVMRLHNMSKLFNNVITLCKSHFTHKTESP
jgi:hypothetical protein